MVPHKEFFKKIRHHAVILIDAQNSQEEKARDIAQIILGQQIVGNSDFYECSTEVFSIDDARNIRQLAKTRSFSGRRVFLISAHSFNIEAQNALLKLFEEPASGTTFLLRINSTELLLPTVRSRMIEFNCEEAGIDLEDARYIDFINLGPIERMKLLKEMIDTKEKISAFRLLDSLERILERHLSKDISMIDAVKLIQDTRRRLTVKGGNMKMHLETLCLLLPKILVKKES